MVLLLVLFRGIRRRRRRRGGGAGRMVIEREY